MNSPATLHTLRTLREELTLRFPQAAVAAVRTWETGWEALDEQAGGLEQGTLTELCSPMAEGTLFVDRILGAVAWRRSFAGLIDCGRTFDPGSYAEATFERVLCVFCQSAEPGVKAADLLLRDGNLPILLLDLQAVSGRVLDRIPSSTWHRLLRLVEKSGTAFVVLTPQPIIGAARLRITLRGEWSLRMQRQPREELIRKLRVQVFRRGHSALPVLDAPAGPELEPEERSA